MLTNPIPEKSKFALIAVKNAYTQLSSKGFPPQLSDGTWVLQKIPVDIDKGWKEWIGALRYKEFKEANLVLICAQRSKNPEILDAHHKKLGNKLSLFFNTMHLDGVLGYQVSNLILGSYYDNRFEIRQMSKLPMFYRTKGYRASRLTVRRLEKAVFVRKSLQEIDVVADSFTRLIRGWNVLMDGLQSNAGQERIHQFVRALEALILPDIGKTKKQFVQRCQTFTTANPNNDLVLKEAFDLRSMSEHLNDWKLALALYAENQREDLALLRTRQMEKLACFAYSRILKNKTIRNHFSSEAAMGSFWHEQASKRMTTWGNQLDLASVR
jgi:hypothetical protein